MESDEVTLKLEKPRPEKGTPPGGGRLGTGERFVLRQVACSMRRVSETRSPAPVSATRQHKGCGDRQTGAGKLRAGMKKGQEGEQGRDELLRGPERARAVHVRQPFPQHPSHAPLSHAFSLHVGPDLSACGPVSPRIVPLPLFNSSTQLWRLQPNRRHHVLLRVRNRPLRRVLSQRPQTHPQPHRHEQRLCSTNAFSRDRLRASGHAPTARPRTGTCPFARSQGAS